MEIVEITAGDRRIEMVYDRVLVPSFPSAELCTLEDLTVGLAGGETTVFAVYDDGGPVAASVGDWSARSRIQLLSYIAVLPAGRSGGTGGTLLEHSLAQWRETRQPCAIVAEIELPAGHDSSEAYGDPTARARFYAKHGARVLDVPYFQPGLGAGEPRCYGMALIVLHLDPALAGVEPETMAPVPLRNFMVDYLTMSEDAVDDDAAVTALLAAMSRPGGCPLLPMSDLDKVPVSAAPEA